MQIHRYKQTDRNRYKQICCERNPEKKNAFREVGFRIQQLWQGDVCDGGKRKENEAIKKYK